MGLGTAIGLAFYDQTGGLWGFPSDPNVDEFERHEEVRLRRRRPIQEIIDELGEGRGAYRRSTALAGAR
jgi:hypothetical protein